MSSKPYLDNYDEEMLAHLEEGKKYKGWEIKSAYQKHTAIINEDTVRDRAKNITSTPVFDCKQSGFVFVGVDA